MGTNKKLRTPIIKPRTQGGTFYTFGSAMEDIGLNITSNSNKVGLSHYVLLDIPSFSKSSLNTKGDYNKKIGDNTFAEYFQDAILNMETVIRNQDDYNYASLKTVSERVFWKWLFKANGATESTFVKDGNYYYEQNANTSIAKAFGKIVSGSQRIDEYGIYNETYVQIPSSYGQMRILFKETEDENYILNQSYESSNNGIIEGIEDSELDSSIIKSTGINGEGIFDDSSVPFTYNTGDENKPWYRFEAELSIDKLREYYNDSTLTIDDIGFGKTDGSESFDDSFLFNAILVYYSVYDSTGKNVISTNAFGLYILNNAIEVSGDTGTYRFPELTKVKTSREEDGTSFSFRLNIKPTSAYSGDVVVSDNSTGAFNSSEDFNDVIKNLSRIVEILKTNVKTLNEIAISNQSIKNLSLNALEKVTDLEKTVNDIKDSSVINVGDVIANNFYATNPNKLDNPVDLKTISDEILNNITVNYDQNSSDVWISINTESLSENALKMANSITKTTNNKKYCDTTKLIALLLASKE